MDKRSKQSNISFKISVGCDIEWVLSTSIGKLFFNNIQSRWCFYQRVLNIILFYSRSLNTKTIRHLASFLILCFISARWIFMEQLGEHRKFLPSGKKIQEYIFHSHILQPYYLYQGVCKSFFSDLEFQNIRSSSKKTRLVNHQWPICQIECDFLVICSAPIEIFQS